MQEFRQLQENLQLWLQHPHWTSVWWYIAIKFDTFLWRWVFSSSNSLQWKKVLSHILCRHYVVHILHILWSILNISFNPILCLLGGFWVDSIYLGQLDIAFSSHFRHLFCPYYEVCTCFFCLFCIGTLQRKKWDYEFILHMCYNLQVFQC